MSGHGRPHLRFRGVAPWLVTVWSIVICLSSWPLAPVHAGATGRIQADPAPIGSDFNGDGFGDLAVGVPEEEVSGKADAGAVNVICGSADGLSAAGDQFWNQDSPGILDKAQSDDVFGSGLATGNFDG